MKKTLAAVLIATAAATSAAASSVPSKWAQESIQTAKDGGLDCFADFNKGYTDAVTREEICALIAETVGIIGADGGAKSGGNPFSDTDSQAVLTAYRLGIVDGTGEGTFMPNKKVSRQEAAKMFSNTANLFNFSQNYDENLFESFADSEKISPWAREFVSHTSAVGLFGGDELGNFNPLGELTLEQSIAICSRLMSAKKPVDTKEIRQWGLEPTLVSHSNFPRNGSKSLENTTVFPA